MAGKRRLIPRFDAEYTAVRQDTYWTQYCIREAARLRNLAQAFDMLDFGKYRHNLDMLRLPLDTRELLIGAPERNVHGPND